LTRSELKDYVLETELLAFCAKKFGNGYGLSRHMLLRKCLIS